jgi:hypothetical protein
MDVLKWCFQSEKSSCHTKNGSNLPYEINKTDLVKLVKEAWAVSFAHEETIGWAVLNRGWGPKALNYNVLLHPEILVSKPKDGTLPQQKAIVTSKLSAAKLNLSRWPGRTPIDHIVLEKNKDSWDVTLAEIREKPQWTWKGMFHGFNSCCRSLYENILTFVHHLKEQEDEWLHQRN